jgi:hypothetical protein
MVAALAGPPLICHPINIGNARSLPWRNSNGWDGVDPSYKPVATLTSDTLDLLAPSTPLKVRMETIRRAAIYAARYDRLGDEITSRLLARVASSETSGKSDPLAWFDAGYFVETVRQATFVYKFDMLSEAERNQWKMRGEALALDGKPWIEKAIRLGGQGMEGALANVNEYRQADLKRAAQVPR